MSIQIHRSLFNTMTKLQFQNLTPYLNLETLWRKVCTMRDSGLNQMLRLLWASTNAQHNKMWDAEKLYLNSENTMPKVLRSNAMFSWQFASTKKQLLKVTCSP